MLDGTQRNKWQAFELLSILDCRAFETCAFQDVQHVRERHQLYQLLQRGPTTLHGRLSCFNPCYPENCRQKHLHLQTDADCWHVAWDVARRQQMTAATLLRCLALLAAVLTNL